MTTTTLTQQARDELRAQRTKVQLDAAGHIFLGTIRLTQRDATDIALALTEAVEDSIWRNQIGTPYYRHTVNILRRQNAPLGKAIAALRKVWS